MRGAGPQTYDLADIVNPSHPLPPGCTIRVLGMAPGRSLVGSEGSSRPAGSRSTPRSSRRLDDAVTHDHVDVINESFGSNHSPDTNDDPTAVFQRALVRAGIRDRQRARRRRRTSTRSARRPARPGHLGGSRPMFSHYAQTNATAFQLSNGSTAATRSRR
jgi:hypothetical protein